LLIPGLLLLWYNLIPFFNRGQAWRAEPDGSVSVKRGNTWTPLLEYEFTQVVADGTTINFTPVADMGAEPVVLPQCGCSHRITAPD
jgi:hypothetical protein